MMVDIEVNRLSEGAKLLVLATATRDDQVLARLDKYLTEQVRQEKTTVLVEMLHLVDELMATAHWNRLVTLLKEGSLV